MSTFALVHGAWHGGWCFELLTPLLEAAGHNVVAPDLPVEDVGAGASEYAGVVHAALGEAEDVIVVGHSRGGVTAPLVAELRSIEHLVFLCAAIPLPGVSFLEQLESEPILQPGAGQPVADELDRTWWDDEDAFREAICHDCPPAVAGAAFARLRRQARPPVRESSPLVRLPEAPISYVVCGDDRSFSPEWSRRAARERLNVEPIELPGSHSPYLSRPDELAAVLCAIAE